MGSSPEMERFEVSNDDYEASMDPLRRRFRQSRKKTIYGVFASDDSDSEDKKTGFSRRDSAVKRKGANYTAPIAFVSGGVKPGNRPTGENNDIVGEKISDDEDDKRFLDQLNRRDSDSDSEGEGQTKEKVTFRRPLPTFGAGRRAAMNSAATNKSGFGAWERHTKGIGMKLLEQMGYEHGKGLGSEGQGITTPVQAAPRADVKAAVGFFGSEATQAPRRGNEAPPVTRDTNTDGIPRYKKKGAKSSTISYDLKTTDEILANFASPATVDAPKQHSIFLKDSEMSKVKVIDMTSKEQRVYSGYEAALSRTARKSKRPDGTGLSDEDGAGPDAEHRRQEKRREGLLFDCPALRYNLTLMLRSDEDEIRRLDRNQRFAEDRCVGIEHEIERLAEIVKVDSVEIDRLRVALDMIGKFENIYSSTSRKTPSNPKTPRIENDASQFMHELRQKCNGMPELPLLMAAMAKPMLEASVSKWKPLSDPLSCIELFVEWCELFHNPSAFEVILKTSWLKVLRRSIINDWEPRECEKMLSLLEAWKPLLPAHLLDQDILQQLVLPKLKASVENWNPLTDTVPIHTWLQPWLPWFGGAERLTEVHDIVLRKLGNCLTTWHPSDGSAHSVLMPWRSVLSIGQMSGFLARYVVPKLEMTLKTFKLNPASQQMEPWLWIMRWSDLVGPTVLVNMLEHHFWPRWIAVLSDWLSQGVQARHRGDPTAASQVYQEVGRWYAGWKGQLPPECMEYPSVKDALTKALAMMERAMRGLPPQEPETVPHASATVSGHVQLPAPQRSGAGTTAPSAIFASTSAVTGPPVTLRKQVEQVAAQRGLLFHPVSNRQVEGQQVYRLETVLVFFDRNVSFVHHPVDGGWHPVSFSELMCRAQTPG